MGVLGGPGRMKVFQQSQKDQQRGTRKLSPIRSCAGPAGHRQAPPIESFACLRCLLPKVKPGGVAVLGLI